MKKNQVTIIKSSSLFLLCCLLTSWLFTLPLPEYKASSRYFSVANSLAFKNAKDRQLKCNDQGITSTAARFNGVPELTNSAYKERATLSFLFDIRNFTYYHARLFYDRLYFVTSHSSKYSPDFFILFRKLRL